MTTAQMTTYKFGVMSGAWLIDAPTDLIADAAMLLWLRTDAPIVVYEPVSRTLAFTFEKDVEGALNAHFGGFTAFVEKNRDAIDVAIESIREVA